MTPKQFEQLTKINKLLFRITPSLSIPELNSLCYEIMSIFDSEVPQVENCEVLEPNLDSIFDVTEIMVADSGSKELREKYWDYYYKLNPLNLKNPI